VDIATLVSGRYGVDGIVLSKDAVASIYRRRTTVLPVEPRPDGLSEETVRKVYWMLSGAWSYGVKNELIPRSRGYIVAEAKCPSEGRRKQEKVTVLWTPEQCCRFFDWAVDNRPNSWAAFYFVAVSGDRVSGNLGLTWAEVDLERATASLVNFVKYHGEPGERVLVEPVGKTSLGHEIVLDPRTVSVLREWKASQSERLLGRGDRHTCLGAERDCPLPGYHDRGLVFPQADGNYRNPNKFRDLFQDAIRAFNRRNPGAPVPMISPHAFRHGWATTSEAVGVSEVVRMDRLDHKSLKMSRHYTQPLPQAKAAAAAAVSDALFAGSVLLGHLGS
jgi:integrase